MKCLLCHAESSVFARNALACPHCGLVYKDPAIHLSAEEESKRYAYHQNSGNDKGYIAFLSRLIDPLAHFLPDTFSALDFGCGPGPTMCYLLKERGGRVKNFDPLFFPEKSLLNEKYEVVTSTEVVEHFKTPQKDWEILAALVAPRGLLAVMTQF
ncbi:MAG: class I SAM-dependent methyltransferase, partial [Bacteriovorax sp.]